MAANNVAYGSGYGSAPSGTDQDQFRNQFLYSTDDPGAAFNNTLRSMGYNPSAANPYMQYIKRAAPGLGLAYQTNAAQGYYGDPLQVSQGNGNGMSGFGEYLRQSLSGSNGGIRAQLSRAAGAMPDLINQLRNSGGNANLQQVNPYLYSLGQQFAQGNGQGTTNAYASYYAPFMTQNLASAYGTGLEAARQNAVYNYAQSPNLLSGDLWNYLLGV